MATKFVRVLTYYKKFQLYVSHNILNLWSREFAWLIKKTFYLHYHNIYGHQTWQGCYIQ